MKPILIVILVFLLSNSLRAQENSQVSLQEVIALANGQSIDRKQAELNIAIADADADLIDASLKPQIRANANLPNYFNTSQSVVQPDGTVAFQSVSQNTGNVGFTASKDFANTNTNVFLQTNLIRFDDFANDFNAYNAVPIRLGVRQPINQFNNTEWNQKLAVENKQLQRILAEQSVGSNAVAITQQYFALLRAQVNEDIAKTNAKNAATIYEIGKERFNLGKISKNDLLQIELSLTSSQQDEISANRDVYEQSYNLKNTANLFDLPEIINAETPLALPDLLLSAEEIADMAWEKNPTRNQIEMQSLMVARDMERAKKDNGFQADLTASVGLVKSATELGKAYQNPKNETLVNVGLSIPLFDGQFRKKSIERAKLNQRFQQENEQYSEKSFKQNIKQLVEQLRLLKKEVQLSKKSYDLAEERYNIANQRFTLGNIDVTDLTIAYSERDNAWRSYIFTLESFFVNYELLKQLTRYDFETNKEISRFETSNNHIKH